MEIAIFIVLVVIAVLLSIIAYGINTVNANVIQMHRSIKNWAAAWGKR